MDVTPLKNRAARLLARRSPDYRAHSERTWQLAPGEASIAPRALFHEADLGRITGLQEVTTLAKELRRIRGGEGAHAPCVAHRLRDVRLLDGHLYRGTLKDRLTSARGALLARGRPEPIEQATLACTLYGNRYFGHFMRDDMTLHLAAEGLPAAVTIERPAYTHEADYRRALGLHARPLRHAHFRELIVLDDIGQTKFKRARYQTMRERKLDGLARLLDIIDA